MQVDRDHTQAARTATLRQRATEKRAADAGLSVADYMKQTGTYPCQEFVERGALMDAIEADHTHAALVANIRQNARLTDEIRALNLAAYHREHKSD